MQANYGETEIRTLLSKARIFNEEIGEYQLYAITNNFDYTVKLSNGTILIKVEDLQDDEKDALTPERLTAIANRFVSSEGKNTTEEKKENPKSQKPQQEKKSNPTVPPVVPKKKTGNNTLGIVIISVLVLAGILTVVAITSKSTSHGGSSYDSVDYERKKMSVEEIERSKPADFLSADGTYRKNIWGDNFKVNCEVTNRATVVTYKDVTVKVTYYTKTKTIIGSDNYVLYETFPPNSTKTVNLRINRYKNVDAIGWDVVSADVY